MDPHKNTLYAADATGSLDGPALRRKAAREGRREKKRLLDPTPGEVEEAYQKSRESHGLGRNTARPPSLRQDALRKKFKVTDRNIRIRLRHDKDGNIQADMYGDEDRD